MRKAETSRTSRTRAGVAGVAITGFALPVVVGLPLTFVGPAAADVTNKQSFTSAQAQSAASNVMSLRGATTPPIGKSKNPSCPGRQRGRPIERRAEGRHGDGIRRSAAASSLGRRAPSRTTEARAALLAANGAAAADARRPADRSRPAWRQGRPPPAMKLYCVRSRLRRSRIMPLRGRLQRQVLDRLPRPGLLCQPRQALRPAARLARPC